MSAVPSRLPMGAALPTSGFADCVRRAAVAARNGQSRWVDVGDVKAHVTLREARTNLPVIGLEETEDRPYRVVDGLLYARWRTADRSWKSLEAPPGAASIGTPLAWWKRCPRDSRSSSSRRTT